MKSKLQILLQFTLVCAAITAFAEPQPLMTTPGQVLLSEDFSGPSLPKAWDVRLHAECFSVVDGALRRVARPDTERTPCVISRLMAQDLTIRFSAKFVEAGILVLVIDGHNESFGGNNHLIKLELRPGRLTLFQKRGTRESKQAQTEANRKARVVGEKIARATPEQLADEDHYRTEEIAAAPIGFGTGEWHEVILEINGNDIVAQVDEQPPLLATANVADAGKNRIVFGISGRGSALIDNVRVTENKRRSDWPQVKATLGGTGPTEAKTK